jgi:hypothetical protein
MSDFIGFSRKYLSDMLSFLTGSIRPHSNSHFMKASRTEGYFAVISKTYGRKFVRQILTENPAKLLPDNQTDADTAIAPMNL